MLKTEIANKMIATEMTIGRTETEIEKFVKKAVEYDVYGVCVFQNMVLTALKASAGKVKVCTVAGYPSGIDVPATKIADVELSASNGAFEVDVGVNLSAWKSNDLDTLCTELEGCVEAGHRFGCQVSAVLNTYQLKDEEIRALSALCKKYGVDSIKTTSADTEIPRPTVLNDADQIRLATGDVPIKVEGQINDLNTALEFIEHGTAWICSNHAFEILDEVGER